MSQKPLSYNALSSQVNALTNTKPVNTQPTASVETSYSTYMKPPYIFAAIPIVIGIALFYLKPFFIMDADPKYPSGEGPPILSYKKLYSSLLFSFY